MSSPVRLSLLVPFSFSALGIVGCVSRQGTSGEPVAALYTVRVDRGENGAAPARPIAEPPSAGDAARSLAFEMVGFGGSDGASGTSTERAAASQAAIIDAFVKALIEARTGRGQSTADFTAKLGPRMIVRHRTIGAGYEVRVTLLAPGNEMSFIVRDGVLQHPPRDMRLVRRMFEETNGEFSLLAVDRSPTSSLCTARVACYRPAGYEPQLAGGVSGDSTGEP